MKVSDFTMCECKVWEAAATGTLVDRRMGDYAIDSPEKGTEWGPERTVRAEVIVDLLIGNGEAASMAVRGVRIQGAHITGDLKLEASTLRCPLALLDCSFDSAINLNEATAVSVRLTGSYVPSVSARQLRTRGDLRLDKGFSVSAGVELADAHIGGQLDCTGGHFFNSNGPALRADGLTVDGSIICGEGFSASGEVNLVAGHIGGRLKCSGGQFSNPDGVTLNLRAATVSSSLLMETAVLEGTLDLTTMKTSSYQDNLASWPEVLRLNGFVYDAIEGASTKGRLKWLLRNESGYSPQIYDQLAVVYRAAGQDDDARRVLIAKQRRRFAQRNLVWRFGGYVLDGLVGYGYRTWLAAFWLAGFLILGTWLFGSVYRSELTPANKPDVQPPFQPFFYTLDLLLPVVSLHVRDAWIAQGAAQVWSVIFIIVGWILATAVVLSLTGLLKRD
jgi:hypothetical protein